MNGAGMNRWLGRTVAAMGVAAAGGLAMPATALADHGGVRVGVSIGRRERIAERVWVPPVYEDRQRIVHVPAVYEARERQVWCPPEFEDRYVTVDVPPVVERCRVTRYDRRGRPCGYEWVEKVVRPGHRETRRERVLVRERFYKTVVEQVLVSPACEKVVTERVLVREGHWAERRYHDRPRGAFAFALDLFGR